MRKKNKFQLWFQVFFFMSFFAVVNAVNGQTIDVSSALELQNAVASANNSGGNTTINLKDGVYTITKTLYISAPFITIVGQSGIRENVVIQGDAMSSNAGIGNIFTVSGKNFEIRNVTLQKCGWHLIQIKGENNADDPVVRNCILRDSYEQLLKVSVDLSNTAVSSDNGLVENCLFEYSAGVGPQWYIGGIDAHAAKNWVVRDNTFKSIISPDAEISEFAVHFWSDSANNLVERNLIINCDRGIGFGLDNRRNTGGKIRNNMIYHEANAGQRDDVGIALTNSPGSQVYNNTIFMQNDFPWAIEYRFSATKNIIIANNLTNKPIKKRDGASGTVTNNITNAAASWFQDVVSANLHLAYAIDSVVNKGQTMSGLVDDFDKDLRPQGGGIDIGADEFVVDKAPQPPKNLRIIH